MGLIAELKRRNVFRMAGLYLVAAWLILQVANNILPVFGTPPWVLKTLIITLAIGLVPVIALSWAFEFTPEGLKRDEEVDAGSTEARNTARRLNHLLIGVLALAVTYFAVDKFIIGRAPAPEAAVAAAVQKAAAQQERPSIAVLPFDNRSAVAEDAFFVDGMHDDILTQLSKISGLKVISRTSVETFRDSKLPIRDIARQLGVKTILEGGVQRGGNRVRINMQLIDAETDTHLWAETYDRELTAENIFAIQSEVTAAITGSLKATLTEGEKAGLDDIPTKSLAAWEAFQLGKQQRAKRTSSALADAEAHFKKAIALDPNFLLAQVLLADTYISQVWYSGKDLNQQLKQASTLIDAVLKVQPAMPEALSSAGAIALYSGDLEAGERQLRHVLALQPDYVPALHVMADHLPSVGKADEALVLISRAIVLDPLSPVLYGKRATIAEMTGRFDEAKADYQTAGRIDPNFPNSLLGLGGLNAYVYRRLDLGVEQTRQAVRLDPGNPQMQMQLSYIYLDIGMTEPGVAAAREMHARFGERYRCQAAYAELMIGNLPASRQLAEKAAPTAPCRQYWEQRQGRHQTLIDSVFKESPALSSKEAKLDFYQALFAYPALFSLQALGRDEEAKSLARRMLETLKAEQRKGLAGYGVLDVILLTQAGRHDQALSALEAAVDAGWQGPFWRYYRDYEPALDPIRGQPRFIAAFGRLEAAVAAQRARLPASSPAAD